MKIKNRIKELKYVQASSLLPNPKNWRTHGKEQTDALKGVLSEIGIANAVLARETPEGLMLIDGHLRTETLGKEKIPVLVLDVDEAESDKLLLTIDPLAAMAGINRSALDELMESTKFSNNKVSGLLESLTQKTEELKREIFAPELNPQSGGTQLGREDIQKAETKLEGRFVDSGAQTIREVCCPNCGAEFGLDVGS